MKKIITLVLTVFVTLTVMSQPPLKRTDMGPTNQLPNQFRDFVDHQQRWENNERPQIEKKDGKVIITMTEEQFRKMQMIRRAQRMRMARFRHPQGCPTCQVNPQRFQRPPLQEKF